MNAHSIMGGSSAKRFLACGFSVVQQITSGSEKELAGIAAHTGTFAHEVLAECLENDNEPLSCLGKSKTVVDVHDNSIELKIGRDIKLDALSTYFLECQKLKEGAKEVYIEKQFRFPDMHLMLQGTVDFCAVKEDGIYIRDYKNGSGIPVSTYSNPQLLYYAFLAITNLEKAAALPSDMKVELGIVQPNFRGPKSDIWTLNVKEVKSWGHEILLPRMHQLSRKEDAKAHKGEHCLFCPVLLDCPEMRKDFETFSEIGSLDMISDSDLDKLAAKKDNVAKIVKAIETALLLRMKEGRTFTHAKLVDKSKRPQWKQGSEEIFREKIGDEAFILKTPSEMKRVSTEALELAEEWSYIPVSNEKRVDFVKAKVEDSNEIVFKDVMINEEHQ